jgi:hypothetical protein
VFTSQQTVLRSALEYRAYNLDVYGIDLPMRKPWTSRPSVIDAILSLFDLSTEVLTSVGSSIRATDREPGSQLPALAAILFESIKERLDELSKLLFMELLLFTSLIIVIFSAGMDVQHDMEELQQRFNILRPEVLETLSESSFNLCRINVYNFFQGDTAMKNLRTVWQNVIKISTLLLLYVIEIRSIPRVKIHTLREYNPTSNDSKTIIRQPSSSGISNMVSDTLC